MKRFQYFFNFLAACLLLDFLFFANTAFAKTDLSIAETDISFSKNNGLDGETIKIFARVFNVGDTDVYGYVVFLNNGKEMADPQPISIRTNTYDDAFIDWKASQGAYNIEAKIIGENPADDNLENNNAEKKNYFVDKDTDYDGIGDTKDDDIDGDGLTNEQEAKLGTDSLNPDTDNDLVNDKIDAFPLDKTETRDTDNDGIGDNKDLDADGDGLSNIDEIQKYGTNPLSADSDNDGLLDKKEIDVKTDPNKADTDGDGIIDSKDALPLDASKWQAGLMNSVIGFFKGNKYSYFLLGIPALLILLFLFRRKKEK